MQPGIITLLKTPPASFLHSPYLHRPSPLSYIAAYATTAAAPPTTHDARPVTIGIPALVDVEVLLVLLGPVLLGLPVELPPELLLPVCVGALAVVDAAELLGLAELPGAALPPAVTVTAWAPISTPLLEKAMAVELVAIPVPVSSSPVMMAEQVPWSEVMVQPTSLDCESSSPGQV